MLKRCYEWLVSEIKRKGVCFIGSLADLDISRLMKRGEIPEEIKSRVRDIVEDVRQNGLRSVIKYTLQFDNVQTSPSSIKVTPEEIEEAYDKLIPEELDAICESVQRVTAFHLKQKQCIKDILLELPEGSTCLKWLPLKRVGIYAPAGKAPLPSSVLMAAIPATIAGVKDFILCSPPQKNGKIDPSILITANECGIKSIYKIGGAQAIAAMAYGCGLFDSVDIISGPGNVYTAYAKQLVSGEGIVKIDTLAGPSEVLIIADETADAALIASDMLAQAEHGPNSSSICITDCPQLAQQVKSEVGAQLAALPANDPVATALSNFGAVLVVAGLQQAVDFANSYAPEHLEIFTKEPEPVANQIINSGAIFLETAEVFGDYGISGSNHILPTGRSCRFASGVSVFTFLKYQLIERLTKDTQSRLAKLTAAFARVENLEAHARAAELRR